MNVGFFFKILGGIVLLLSHSIYLYSAEKKPIVQTKPKITITADSGASFQISGAKSYAIIYGHPDFETSAKVMAKELNQRKKWEVTLIMRGKRNQNLLSTIQKNLSRAQAGDQVLIHLDTHGAEPKPGEETHSIATSPNAIINHLKIRLRLATKKILCYLLILSL